MKTFTLFIRKYLKKPVVIHNKKGILTVYGDERNLVSLVKDDTSCNTFQSVIFKTDNDIRFIGKTEKINIYHYEPSYDEKIIEEMTKRGGL
tara:strand:+ start:7046 stop:7318 length:273 start_codon:yes stop_codon:yes gene_type:complete